MHDSSLSSFGAHKKMSEMCKKHDAKVVVDSAFDTSGSPCLMKSAQVDPIKTAAARLVLKQTSNILETAVSVGNANDSSAVPQDERTNPI